MKKNILALLAFAILFASCEDDNTKFDVSLFEGKWEIVEIQENGKPKEYLDECQLDNIWTFAADGKITNYNPCENENAALVTANWRVDGDILHVDGAVSIAATSQILELTADRMVLLRQWGSYETITEIYRKNNNKQIIDYAQEMTGEYDGLVYYADHEISNRNLPATYAPASLVIKKIMSGIASVEYKDFFILGEKETLLCEKAPITREWGVTSTRLPNTVGPLNVTRDNVVYDMIMQRTYTANGVDSIYSSLWGREKGQSEYKEFYFFRGKKIK